MKQPLILFFLLLSQTLLFSGHAKAQQPDCNKLGAWIWYVEQTGFTHETLADTLSSLGAKRIYVKVADGIIDTVWWHTIVDEELIETYHAHDMEVYGWSYNYPGSEYSQAVALYQAAETGYDGYVVDVEHQFDGDSANLHNLFNAFHFYKQLALDQHIIDTTFKLGVTTWGNPIDHWFRVDVMDPFVDAYFPQTYVEIWGSWYMNNITFWIDSTNNEYRAIGATKPIHHICATEKELITSEQIDEFIAASGPQTSLWRVPGGGTPLSIWNTWNEVNWRMNFCDTIVGIRSTTNEIISAFPNPFLNQITISCNNREEEKKLFVYNSMGQKVVEKIISNYEIRINTTGWNSGLYVVVVVKEGEVFSTKIVKK